MSPSKYWHTCENNKLAESWSDQPDDALFYSYTEGGSFHPGPKFGCIHHKPLE